MSNLFVTIFSYFIDKFFGEFRFIKHPIIYMGDLISFFEKHFYKDSIARGFLLVVFVLSVTFLVSFSIYTLLSYLPLMWNITLTSIFASMFIAHHMLKDAVYGVVYAQNQKEAISMLVSRDTKDMTQSDIYKASIETYAENLSDGVVAPLFYLLLFNIVGVVLYKAINTMDSMVGYRNEKYEKFGKIPAILDDVVNFIPARLSAVFIMLRCKNKNIFAFYKDGKKHDSPNAGHPITAMALCLGVKLGGDTSYFGKIKKKPYFGEGREEILKEDVLKALKIG